MRLTIITPVINGVRYISECVENVRSQGLADVEHLVIDGGSTDGTRELLAELAVSYPHLRYISEKDAGQSDAMNKGIRKAAGDIIGFLNVDDYYAPGALGEALAFLDQHPKVDFVVGNCRVIKEHLASVSINEPRDLRLENLLLGWEYGQFPVNPSAYFYRKRIHSIVGEYDIGEHYAMDLAFLLTCAAKVRMAHVSRLWGNFRMMPGTKTYEDAKAGTASVRAQKLRSLWIDRLSPRQRFKMHLIKTQKRSWRAAKWYFFAIGRRLGRLVQASRSGTAAG